MFGRVLGELDHARQGTGALLVAPGGPVGFVVLAAALHQARLVGRVVQHRFVDIQHHGGLQAGDGGHAVVLGQGIPLLVRQGGKQA